MQQARAPAAAAGVEVGEEVPQVPRRDAKQVGHRAAAHDDCHKEEGKGQVEGLDGYQAVQ